eukprot:TRINITY_DN12809_c0_g3_i1.p1 TRINITY_DN12809_c0_g3~~TRINITY_DN12809_c0_g3_i1.p1  ORF type:complete len:796 (+),score=154.01 TRINITY_DN12809_c0_g3_i1:77-2464(+)
MPRPERPPLLEPFDDFFTGVRAEYERLLARTSAECAHIDKLTVNWRFAPAVARPYLRNVADEVFDVRASSRELAACSENGQTLPSTASFEDHRPLTECRQTPCGSCQPCVEAAGCQIDQPSHGDFSQLKQVSADTVLSAPRPFAGHSTGDALAASENRSMRRLPTSCTFDSDQSSSTAERMEEKLNVEKVVKLKYIFRKLDVDADGRITADDLHRMLQSNGMARSSVAGLHSTLLDMKRPRSCEFADDEEDSLEIVSANDRGGPSTEAADATLDFEEFAALVLHPSDALAQLPEGVAADLQLIRNVVIRQDAKDAIEEVFTQRLTKKRSVTSSVSEKRRMCNKLDSMMAVVIIINTVTLGYGTDHDSDSFQILETVFNCMYLMEFLVKLSTLGPVEFFFGSDWSWHWLDGSLCVFAALDVLLQLAVYAQGQLNHSLLAMLRLVRLARLQRIMRLLRYRVFSELTLMVKGVAAGLRTLFWAIVLLFCVIYVFALILRQLLADDIDSCIIGADSCSNELQTGLAKHLLSTHIDELFGSVPNCMFTVFRCVSGDCASPKGTPILMALYDIYGPLFVLPYCVAFLFVTFGIFNLIVAIFVETVMDAARTKRRTGADQETLQVGNKLQRLVVKFLNVDSEADPEPSSCWKVALRRAQHLLSVSRNDGAKYAPDCGVEFDKKIDRQMFLQVVHDEEVKELLDDLDIGSGEDRAEFFDVLDADGSGALDLRELVVGLMKLRGGADKSDVVAALLGVRALQTLLKDYMAEVGNNFDMVMRRQKEMLGRLAPAEAVSNEKSPVV